jgi:hypothetical protein
LADEIAADTGSKDQKDLKKVIEQQSINYVETAQKGITVSGYVDTSYTEQFGGRGTGFGSGAANLRQFDVNNNNFNVNAAKIAFEKALPDKNDWAAGFRVDLIYGSDAKFLGDSGFNTSAPAAASGSYTSSNSSGLAIEQALVKFRVPVGNGLDLYAGKFVTFLGYEVIESPANLNFSRGLLFTNAIPLTHTGVYADYKFNDIAEAKLGIVDGWNNSVSNGSTGGANATDSANDYPFGGKAITGQINITAPGKNANIANSFYFAPSGDPGVVTPSLDNGPIVVYDVWGNWNPTFVKDSALTLGFNVDLGYDGATGLPYEENNSYGQGGDGTTGLPATNDSTTWWGGALYASYKFNKTFTLSGRGEYLHEDASLYRKFGQGQSPSAGTGVRVLTPQGFTDTTQDDFSYTVTAAFNIWDNLLTRAEYRVDLLSSGSNSPSLPGFGLGNPGPSSVQNEFSLEAVYSF